MINPAVTSVVTSFASGTPCYSALTWISSKGELSPDLAERWEVSDDARSHTFHLRRNVTWHDGQPFTSADVKFSLENVASKIHPWGRGAFKMLERVDTPDEHTAVLRLTAPSASLMHATHNAMSAILPRHIWEGTEILKNPHNKQPVGTGPFKLVEYLPGDRIRYVRNENFYFEGQPDFDEFILRIISDAAARVAAFENGEIDYLYSNAIPSSELQRISEMPGVKLVQTNVSAPAYLGIINMKNKPYDDVRVRQALAHAIDRKFLRDTIVPKYAENQIGPVPPSNPLFKADLPDYAFDPGRAEALLNDAGYPRGSGGTRFDFRLLWPASDIRLTRIADIVHQNLAAVGINVVLQPLERATMFQRGFVGEAFDMLMESYSQHADPDIGVERLYNSNNIHTPPLIYTNNSSYRNDEVDRLFDEQRVQTNPAQRKETYARIQEIIWRDVPVLPLMAYYGVSAYRSDRVENALNAGDGNKDSFARAKAVL
ncbi:ABC transporter substrate-binding protein [Mesorhizobium sp.]|uniref:ABC transporter substrate-binding protein n=1 Tax=Mesorhizobium sp. TaxID=1871066 RepID=UPI0025DEEE5D|nr:ABC transporter substrate-binding protein [Mesorhizobium sp.]